MTRKWPLLFGRRGPLDIVPMFQEDRNREGSRQIGSDLENPSLDWRRARIRNYAPVWLLAAMPQGLQFRWGGNFILLGAARVAKIGVAVYGARKACYRFA